MDLSYGQRDALTELINIGYGRAAGALSELTGHRIVLEVPRVTMHEIEAIGPLLETSINHLVASVDQSFSGAVSGSALLMLDQSSALGLSRMLSDQHAEPGEFDSNAKEIITEVGNILLNACLGVFGNLLQIQVTFAVPRLQLESITGVLRSVTSKTEEQLRYGLMIHTRFTVRAGDVTGYLVIILGIASMDRLLHELDNWENRQLR